MSRSVEVLIISFLGIFEFCSGSHGCSVFTIYWTVCSYSDGSSAYFARSKGSNGFTDSVKFCTRPCVWMDDLRFNVLFINSISVISGQCSDDNERLCAMELRLRLRRFHLE